MGRPAPNDPVGKVVKSLRYRRDRASKACEICHARKVRCDMVENFPCTNCKAFSLECKPRPGRGKTQRARAARAAADSAADSAANSTNDSVADSTASRDGPGSPIVPARSATGTDKVKLESGASNGSAPGLGAPPFGDNLYVWYPKDLPMDISALESP